MTMSTLRHSERLRQKIELVLPELVEIGTELFSHPNIRDLYADFLVTVHQGMRASVSLLQTAFERCRAMADTDPVAAALAPYYGHHVKEEDHDYWALEDLEVLGVSRAEVLRRMPSPSMASMMGPSTTGCCTTILSQCLAARWFAKATRHRWSS